MFLYSISVTCRLNEDGKEELPTKISGDPNHLQCLRLLSLTEHVVNGHFIEKQ